MHLSFVRSLQCHHLYDIIFAEKFPTVRLVGGATSSEGRLEVLYNGTWGTVCDDFFNSLEEMVVCRQLGFIGVISLAGSILNFGVGEGPIWLDDVECTGSEDSILNCSHRGFGVHNCDHTEDVGIICGKVVYYSVHTEW